MVEYVEAYIRFSNWVLSFANYGLFGLFAVHYGYPLVACVRDFIGPKWRGASWHVSWVISRSPRNVYKDKSYIVPASLLLGYVMFSGFLVVTSAILAIVID